ASQAGRRGFDPRLPLQSAAGGKSEALNPKSETLALSYQRSGYRNRDRDRDRYRYRYLRRLRVLRGRRIFRKLQFSVTPGLLRSPRAKSCHFGVY
ncbi:MAG: hypothetical protein KAH12_00405, partial [Anaerolineales bacterium]|nr:hypothetical protein [Anaerolineales bacterium]